MEQHEMNFWDLCVVIGRAFGRLCRKAWDVCCRMMKLTYRYCWIVCTIVVLGIAASLYYTRADNTIYRMDAIAILNGPSIQQFEQAYAPLRSGRLLPKEDARLYEIIHSHKAHSFTTFRVIDCLEDGKADYVDFKSKSSPKDTVEVQMHDRLCLQFRIKARDLDLVPEIEQAMLTCLNRNEAMRRSYEVYAANLRDEVNFNHSQAQKLDSLTSQYYFHNRLGEQPVSSINAHMIWTGDWRVHLFLDDIYEQRERLQLDDYRMQLATAPVVLENHFVADPRPVNGRNKMVVIFFLLGWIGGCALADIVDKRKAIAEWLKK